MRTLSVVRKTVMASVLAIVVIARVADVHAQAPLIGGLGGPVGYGTACLSPNDDGSSNAISIAGSFPSGLRFFSMTHTQMYVNTNGNITFAGPVSVFTPNPFPVASQPMIAPYWADVDIRPDGPGGFLGLEPCGGYGSSTGSPGNAACQNPSENGVWWFFEPGRMIVTWHRVGYYACHLDRRMNFQLILTSAPDCGVSGDFDVEFRYNQCEWETGDASGGTGGFGGVQAQAGFDAGDNTNYVAIMGSRMAGIASRLCTMSNVGVPGIWRFQIRGGTVMCPDAGMVCSTGMQGICGEGRMQCVGSGTMCVPVTGPQPSACNGLDNDCNGTIDTGPCPAGQVCDGAQCVAMCVEGGCFAGQSCSAQGTCIDTACVGVTCPAGQRCRGGTCMGACSGVVCPAGQVCRNGSCVDPCLGQTCDAYTVCEGGVCVPRCPCRACTATQTCQASGHCVDTSCATITCPSGQTCVAGACVDACTGVACPSGQVCMAGQCVPDPGATDAGSDASTTVEPGIVDGGGWMRSDASGDIGGEVTTGDARRDSGRSGTNNAGCACRAASGRSRSGSAAWVFALATALVTFERRRRAIGSSGRRARPFGRLDDR